MREESARQRDAVAELLRVILRGVTSPSSSATATSTGTTLLARTLLFLSYLIKRIRQAGHHGGHSADFDDPNLLSSGRHVYPLLRRRRLPRSRLRWSGAATSATGRFAADTAFWFKPAPQGRLDAHRRPPSYFDVWPDEAPFDPAEPYICIGGSSLFDSGDVDVG